MLPFIGETVYFSKMFWFDVMNMWILLSACCVYGDQMEWPIFLMFHALEKNLCPGQLMDDGAKF